MEPAAYVACTQVVGLLTTTPERFSDPAALFSALERALQNQFSEVAGTAPPDGPSCAQESGTGNDGGVGKPLGLKPAESAPTPESGQVPVLNFEVLGGLPAGDIEALAVTVLDLAATAAQEDLKAIMTGVEDINAAKDAQREMKDEVNQRAATFGSKKAAARPIRPGDEGDTKPLADGDPDPGPPADNSDGTRADTTPSGASSGLTAQEELEIRIAKIKAELDSMSKVGDVDSLRLQMAMDRLSKMMSTLSNLLMEVSATASQITLNSK